ncbi:MAG: putative toxin-antitoxin system toxin component, PIN family [Planctomycetota bacterium]|nr:putative toxin-antitoxin system toxin component, PIN family [Planctomycetota bacterium]
MRVVPDTNTVVSGLLWRGAPYRLLLSAHRECIGLFISRPMFEELARVLQRPKFAAIFKKAGLTPHAVMAEFSALTHWVEPASIPPVIREDPSDDHVLACAFAANAEAIVSGDRHLLEIGAYKKIPILTAPALLLRLESQS